MNIYVGNLSLDVTEPDLEQAFEAFGEVTSAKIITDRQSGRSRGFGFVEMPVKGDGESAIDNLNGTDLKGEKLKVNEARPRSNRGIQRKREPGGGRHGGRRHSRGPQDGGRSW